MTYYFSFSSVMEILDPPCCSDFNSSSFSYLSIFIVLITYEWGSGSFTLHHRHYIGTQHQMWKSQSSKCHKFFEQYDHAIASYTHSFFRLIPTLFFFCIAWWTFWDRWKKFLENWLIDYFVTRSVNQCDSR